MPNNPKDGEPQDPELCLEDAISLIREETIRSNAAMGLAPERSGNDDFWEMITYGVAASLSDDDLKKPLFISQREIFEGLKPLLTKPFSEWERLYTLSILRLAGIK